jgi:L-lactate dehydrogenase
VEFGGEVCLSVPQIVDRRGVETPVPVPMNDAERAGLKNSAETIQRTIGELGF